MYDETRHAAEMLRQSTAEHAADMHYWTIRMDAATVARVLLEAIESIPDDTLVLVCEGLQTYLETGEWSEGD